MCHLHVLKPVTLIAKGLVTIGTQENMSILIAKISSGKFAQIENAVGYVICMYVTHTYLRNV